MRIYSRFDSHNVNSSNAADHARPTNPISSSQKFQTAAFPNWSTKIHHFNQAPVYQARLKNPALKKIMSFAAATLANLKRQAQVGFDPLRTPVQSPVQRHGDFSSSSWSRADQYGTRSRDMLDHRTGMVGQHIVNLEAGVEKLILPWRASAHPNVAHRVVVDLMSNTQWHETLNSVTGQHLSTTRWGAPDANGNVTRQVFNHRSGKTYPEYGVPPQIPKSSSGKSYPEYRMPPQKPKTSSGKSYPEYQIPPRQERSSNEQTKGASHAHSTSEAKNSDPLTAAFALMGLSKNASKTEMVKAYRRLALQAHPDKNLGDPLAKEKFQKLNSAKQLLNEHFEKTAPAS